jgi:hypothetical protein
MPALHSWHAKLLLLLTKVLLLLSVGTDLMVQTPWSLGPEATSQTTLWMGSKCTK